MSLSVKGKVKQVFKANKGVTESTGKSWITRDFVLDTGAEFNPLICFKVFGKDKIEKIFEVAQKGVELEVFFNLSSNEHEGNYYHNIGAWRVKEIEE
jgi:hypothetical protein